jgi:tripartite-type tricarboxylate transporter receptor subunit TctC
MKFHFVAVRAAAFALTMTFAGVAQAQQAVYPAKPVHIICPYAAGGTLDPPTRVVAQELARLTGVPFIVENKPGADTDIGHKYVMASPPDGYTMIVSGNHTPTAGVLFQPPRLNPNTDLTHFARIAVAPSAVSVRSDSPFKTLAEVLDKARAAPDSITYGTSGVGSPAHIFMESLQFRAGVRLRHIPYKGSAPAITDLLGGHIAVLAVSLAPQTPHIRKGSFRALAVSSPERQKDFPALQTVSELFTGLADESWLSLSGPAKVPPQIVARISTLVGTAMADPELQKKLLDMGQNPAYLDAAATAAMMERKTTEYAEIIKRANIKPQ